MFTCRKLKSLYFIEEPCLVCHASEKMFKTIVWWMSLPGLLTWRDLFSFSNSWSSYQVEFKTFSCKNKNLPPGHLKWPSPIYFVVSHCFLVITCSGLTASEGLIITCINGQIKGASCTFRCDTGYQLVGQSTTSTCLSSGSWSQSQPHCESKQCILNVQFNMENNIPCP